MKDEPRDAHWSDIDLAPGDIDNRPEETGACELALFKRAIRERGDAAVEIFVEGSLVSTLDDLLAIARGLGGRLVRETLPSPLGGGPRRQCMFAWPHGVCTISYSDGSDTAFVACVSSDRAFVMMLSDRAKEHLKPQAQSRSGRIFAVVQGRRGPTLVPLGVASVPLERNNYDESTLHAFDHVVADLASATPCGRLVLIDGMPGTGKTFVVRGLLAAQRSAGMFVVVPPDLVRQLSGPVMLPMLLSQKQDDDEGGNSGPIILVLEDADECLAPRMADNIGSVANMLAFGDGIVGSVMDVRLIATTNRPRAEIDDALLRPGRLCRRIPVGPLSPAHAAAVFSQLTGNRPDACRFERPTPLAEVYAAAREAGWLPPPADRSQYKRSSVVPSFARVINRIAGGEF